MDSQSKYEQIQYSNCEQSEEIYIGEGSLVIVVRNDRCKLVYRESTRIQYLRGKNYSHKLHQRNKTHQGGYLNNHRSENYDLMLVGLAIEIRTDILFED